jgi:hypothetical protein
MNKLPKSSVVKGRSLVFQHDTVFKGYKLPYPILGVKSCHYEAKVSRVGDYAHAHFAIRALLTLEDSYDAKPFDEQEKFEEDCDLLDEEDNSGEGYIIEGSVIDLDDVALRIIASSLPIKVVRPGSRLPSSGKGYTVYSEAEYAKKKAEKTNPAFDKLQDFDVEKK